MPEFVPGDVVRFRVEQPCLCEECREFRQVRSRLMVVEGNDDPERRVRVFNLVTHQVERIAQHQLTLIEEE